ncbi:6-phosphogluconate dehydrogenase [Cadophora sp. MPI-SDFR-AT-0126]|nr:6-phosphogluconate dehydrogenase [Leotiomycetes sp. MPI-SDFR-AT-0126]
MDITKVGVIGVGVMGSMLALLLAENGVEVSVYDRSEPNLLAAAEKAKEAGLASKVQVCRGYDELCGSFSSRKVFLFSLPHGGPGDGVLQTLQPHLNKGDIVIDCSNENFRVTQKRQAILESRGVSYIGMGVSGGFSGARHGPSMMPSGEDWALDLLIPLLIKIAAKDDQGRSCVTKIGSGGSGHYVKMIHNGIEHGMMSALCEAWELMDKCLKMNSDDIGEVFDDWCSRGELDKNFLVTISGPVCRAKDIDGNVLLHQIRDAVVQDANNSEGTGVWANIEALETHVPAPSLSAAHNLRLASANLTQRTLVGKSLGTMTSNLIVLSPPARSLFLEDLRQAVYAAILSCFVQGFDLLSQANEREGWGIDLQKVAQIWRAGCIIKSDYITELFGRHYAAGGVARHPLEGDEISHEIKKCWLSLKHVILTGLEADAHLPCLTATLEYLKYAGSVDLPTNFMEAQLDCFGAHGFDLKTEPAEGISKGKHHGDWCMA